MAIIKCPECGHQVSDHAKTCPSCGIDIAGNLMRCRHCGEIVLKDQLVCPNCQESLAAGASASSPVSASSFSSNSSGTSSQIPDEDEPSRPAVPPSASRAKYSAIIIAFTISVVAILVGLYFYKTTEADNEMQAYQNARNSAEPAVWESYLAQYGDAPAHHRDSIQLLLDQYKKTDVEWLDAVANGSKGALERYMRLYPQSIHITEAKLLVDSIDWAQAKTVATVQSLEAYLSRYPEGAHIDEAKDMLERVKSQGAAEEQQKAIDACTRFFDALGMKNEELLTSLVAPEMTSFLHKTNATPEDVVRYLHKLYQDEQVEGMTYSVLGDWTVNKMETAMGEPVYSVQGMMEQKTLSANADKKTTTVYRVNAKVAADGKITELNLQKQRQ